MAKERFRRYNANQCLAYVLLTDYPTFRNPRTCQQVSEMLGKKNHSTISSIVNDHLLPEHMVKKKFRNQRVDVLYGPGADHFFIEKDIEFFTECFREVKIKGDDENGDPVGDVVSCQRIDMDQVSVVDVLKNAAKISVKLPELNQYRYHINGTGFCFEVLKQGRLDRISVPRTVSVKKKVKVGSKTREIEEIRRESVEVALFGSKEPNTRFNGCKQWSETYMVPNVGGFLLEYQHFEKSGLKLLHVHPPEYVGPFLKGWDEQRIFREIFLDNVAKVLDQMRDGGGWQFATNPHSPILYGFYVSKKQKEDSDGSSPLGVRLEIGFDDEITEKLKEKLGEGFGIPGESKIWIDKSRKAIGEGEFETNDTSYAEAIEELPKTHDMARETIKAVVEHEDRISAQEVIASHIIGKAKDLEVRVENLEKQAEQTTCILEKHGTLHLRTSQHLLEQSELISQMNEQQRRLMGVVSDHLGHSFLEAEVTS